MYDNGQGNDTVSCGYVDITALNHAFHSISVGNNLMPFGMTFVILLG